MMVTPKSITAAKSGANCKNEHKKAEPPKWRSDLLMPAWTLSLIVVLQPSRVWATRLSFYCILLHSTA